MRPPLPDPARDERGFILVGVVTFMLALTILGLSLFALSSYEAQFFYASASREQSLQNSESGMELVKALLDTSSPLLQSAHLAEGQLGVTHALAYQQRSALATDTTSFGPVDWSRDVVLVVSARSGGVERTLQAKFTPRPADHPYKYLVARDGRLTYDQSNSTDPSLMVLGGRVWQPVQSAVDTTWTGQVAWSSGRPLRIDTPPAPLADAFVAAHLSAPEPSGASGSFELDNKGRYRITFLNDNAGTAAFFRMDLNDPDAHVTDDHADEDPEFGQYDFYVNDYPIKLLIRGIVVWVIDRGACFKNVVNVFAVDPAVPSALVIVAGPNGRDPSDVNRALWFQGGIQAPIGVPVFLVSQHDIAAMHMSSNAKLADHDAQSVSIVAGGDVVLQGPAPSHQFTLRHNASTMDALADVLVLQKALPPVGGANGYRFVPVAQTWLETTPR